MSAWIVPKAHIDLMVTAVLELERTHVIDLSSWAGETPDDLGHALWAENVNSVNYRYTEFTPHFDYTYDEIPGVLVEHGIRDIDVKKAFDCYDYQSCEHDAWPKSQARHLVMRVLELLPGEWSEAEGFWPYGREGVRS